MASGRTVGASATAAILESDELLRRLRAGEIDMDGYRDAIVESIMREYDELTPEQSEDLREELRDAVETDPVLVEMIRQRTEGAVGPSTA